MPDLLHTILSFIVVLAILIAVHEFGHFWVARRLGVKVLRFSIGFGRPLVRWVGRRDGTEYVLAGIPLGGYVKMLDEREEEVDPAEAHRAFNRQKLWRRAAIVLAGPLFNLFFAVLLYWGILVIGDTGSRALIGTVATGSIAAEAGLEAGDELLRVGDRPTPTWEAAVFALMAEALDGRDLPVRIRDAEGDERTYVLNGRALAALPEDPAILGNLGLAPARPLLPPVLGEVIPGEAAAAAGLQTGDRILDTNDKPVTSWDAWVAMVRDHPGQTLQVRIARGGQELELALIPARCSRPHRGDWPGRRRGGSTRGTAGAIPCRGAAGAGRCLGRRRRQNGGHELADAQGHGPHADGSGLHREPERSHLHRRKRRAQRQSWLELFHQVPGRRQHQPGRPQPLADPRPRWGASAVLPG
jgi:regulator of sigma E protease